MFIIYRLSNHPDLVEILPILLENPENCPICDLYKENPDLDICSDLFKTTLMILIQEKKNTRACLTETDIQKTYQYTKPHKI